MQVVAALAAVAVVALVVTLVTGSVSFAVLAIATAAAGMVLLLRDWRSEQARVRQPSERAGGGPGPDAWAPDISADPDGPSSDARADQ